MVYISGLFPAHSGRVQQTARVDMPEGVTLYFPFQLPGARDVSGLPYTSSLADRPIELKRVSPHIAIEIRGLVNEQDAQQLFTELSDALHWAALDCGFGLTFSRQLSNVYRPNDPVQTAENIARSTGLKRERIDVIVDGGQPYLKRDGEKALTETVQSVGFVLSQGSQAFVQALEAGLNMVHSAGPLSPRLRLACEVYSQTHFLASGFARFQALFIPLEIAAPDDAAAHPAVVKHVERWTRELRSTIEAHTQDDPLRTEMLGLLSRVSQLSKESHTGRIRNFVRTRLRQAGHEDADGQAEAIVRLYRKRGDLTHSGATEVSNDLAELEGIVRNTLKAAWSASG